VSETPEIHGVAWPEAARFLGSPDQAARVEQLECVQGPARGSRVIRVATGGGLEFDLHPDRGLDIGRATIDGIGVAWLSPTGLAAPSFAEHGGLGWLRTFGGGLLTTCGLDAFGPPGVDRYGEYGLHGRVSATPATILEAGLVNGIARVTASVRQAGVFAENLEMRRTISSPVGSRTITISDRISNDGHRPWPLMVLYHCNLGWPLVSADTELGVSEGPVEPLQQSDDDWRAFADPDPRFAERVYLHRGTSTARLSRPSLGLGIEIKVDPASLPCLYQWKMLGEGTYVTGLEPANCAGLVGREALGNVDALPMLEPGESRTFEIELRLRGPLAG